MRPGHATPSTRRPGPAAATDAAPIGATSTGPIRPPADPPLPARPPRPAGRGTRHADRHRAGRPQQPHLPAAQPSPPLDRHRHSRERSDARACVHAPDELVHRGHRPRGSAGTVVDERPQPPVGPRTPRQRTFHNTLRAFSTGGHRSRDIDGGRDRDGGGVNLLEHGHASSTTLRLDAYGVIDLDNLDHGHPRRSRHSGSDVRPGLDPGARRAHSARLTSAGPPPPRTATHRR